MIELEVERIAHGGVSVARHDGRVVFVADAIPGERVLAEVNDAGNARYWRADTVEVFRASEHRRAHPWAEASVDRAPGQRAGGAEFGHMTTTHQRHLKAEVLREAMQRMARLDLPVAVDPVESALAPTADLETGTGWRTRVRLHIDDRGVVGPFAARSHTVVAVDSLPLAVPELADIAPLDGWRGGVGQIDVVAPSVGEPFVAPVASGSERDVPPSLPITEVVDGRAFQLDRGGFWQVHRGAAATLSRAIRDLTDAELFDPAAPNLDLYGGVGLLAASLGDRFGPATKVTSVESDERATEHASTNLQDWIGARAVTARVEQYLAELRSQASAGSLARYERATVVLDPPRAGAGRAVIDHLAALRPAQLLYVACDPVALARDTATLVEQGYQLTALQAYDLFPNTHHLEALARFTRSV
ncbi:MAG TPA: class I SAM-dependent RNA methyltransferase [Candidatus Lumbricidophila sp.]|nr:class I SAM-dependent RNA methyltransferase [Candidatus Lumbricidophila sp.]